MPAPSLAAEFRNSLKNPLAEELVDIVLFRPLAFIFVKLTFRLPLTPNQTSVLAMAVGIAGGWFLARGGLEDLAIGSLLFGLSNILDCADGMIARLKKNGTMTGRIVDGLVDYVTNIAVYVGLGIGLTRAVQAQTLHFPCNPWVLVAAAGLSAILHSVASDKYRNAFVLQCTGKTTPGEDEKKVFTEELARLRQSRGRLFDKMLVRIYLGYLSLQWGRSAAAPPSISRTDAVLWNIIGPSTHIVFFIIALLLRRPSVFFVFTIGAANLWMACLLTARALRRKKRDFPHR